MPICSVNGITLGFHHNWVQYHCPRGAAWATPNLRPPPLARFAHDEETGELMTCAIRPDGNTYVSTMRCLANGSKENFSALFAPPGPGDVLPRMLNRSASMEFPFTPVEGGGGRSGGEGGAPCAGLVSYTRVTDFAGFPQSFARYTGVLGGAIGSYVTHTPGESASGHPFVVLSSVTSAAAVLCSGNGGGADGIRSAIAADAAPYVRAAFAAMVGGYGPPLVSARADMPGLSGTAVAAGVAFRLLQGGLAGEEVAPASTGDGWSPPLTIEEELKQHWSVRGGGSSAARKSRSMAGTPSLSVGLRGVSSRGDEGWPWRQTAAPPPRRPPRSKGRKSVGFGSLAGATTTARPKPKFRRVRNRDPATRDSPAWAKVVRNRESARRSNERKRQERARAAIAAATSAGAEDLVDTTGGGGEDSGIAGELAMTHTVPQRTASPAGVKDSFLLVAGGAERGGGVGGSGQAVPSPPLPADSLLWAGVLPAAGWSGLPAQPAGVPLSLEFALSNE